MFIKQLILDGFKSYATRTVINGWDPSFTAITGENGSGKSNILDAICFVLGISQLAQVRASSLRELVYKQGQTGVTKASVTIVFDNTDRASSPMGYEQYQELTVTRQVIVGGKNKYLINGHTAQLIRVQNLFQSVQLNIGNPTFLVMQGRITKVLNMKPLEILGLIEEAAGTRMYETKKQAALTTIEKKELKVTEINKLLTEEITPQLEKLRKECQLFMQWSANTADIQRLNRLIIAYKFYEAKKTLSKSDGHYQEFKSSILQEKSRTKEIRSKIAKIEEEISQIHSRTSSQPAYAKLQEAATSRSKDLVIACTALDNVNSLLADEVQSQNKLKVAIEGARKSIVDHRESSAGALLAKSDLTLQVKSLQNALSALEGQQIGISVGDQGQGSLANQLMDAGRMKTDLLAKAEQSKILCSHIDAEIKELSAQRKQHKASHTKLEGSREVLARKIAAFNVNYEGQTSQSLTECLNNADRKISESNSACQCLREKIGGLSSQCSRIDFQYTVPDSKFDKENVKGTLAQLMDVLSPENCLALEVLAGGKLYNVVVDSEATGKQLLQKGKLKSRITIIPLNKIQSNSLDKRVVQRAVDLVGDENVWPAMSLICFKQEVASAIQFVFGSSFVCRDSVSAEKVTFDKNIKKRSVTLNGDLLDPQGTLTGGSRAVSKPVLMVLAQLSKARTELAEIESQIIHLKDERSEIRRTMDHLNMIQLDQRQLDMITSQIALSEYHCLGERISELSSQRDSANQECSKIQEETVAVQRRAASLQSSIDELESQHSSSAKQAEGELKKIKIQLQHAKKKLGDAEQIANRAEMEAAQLQEELDGLSMQLVQSEASCAKLNEKISTLEEAKAEQQSLFDVTNSKLELHKKQTSELDQQIRNLNKRKDSFEKKAMDAQLEIKKLEHKLERFAKDRDATQARLDAWKQSEASWLPSEEGLFGKANTDYDFSKRSMESEIKLLADKQKLQDAQSKKLNKKVVTMIEKAEKQYNDLLSKRGIIENDKKKIHAVIDELDHKKNEALKVVWIKVNRDFGSIFSTLLPGTSAKLEPPQNGSVLDGLEVKVAFGDVWKESLTELSGGQRSLLALSLILSLLLFKPAPMYILDEVDAALDLSHTQNIGQMLKTHFSTSQFIVVSLKEGMFSNANVIFRTKFVDGSSTVSATVNKKS